MLYHVRKSQRNSGERTIDISFADKKLARSCETERECTRRFGVNGRRVQRRLAELRAADVLADLQRAPGSLHALQGDRLGQYALSVLEPFRLIFAPADDPIPLTADGGVDTKLVKSVRVLEVTDYHGR